MFTQRLVKDAQNYEVNCENKSYCSINSRSTNVRHGGCLYLKWGRYCDGFPISPDGACGVKYFNHDQVVPYSGFASAVGVAVPTQCAACP
jgi:hypothetical protein